MQPALSSSPNSSLPLVKKPVENALLRAAGLMIVTPQGEALFLRYAPDHDHAGEWAWPAGGLEGDEVLEDTAIRETREETGWIPNEALKEVDSSQDEIDFTTFATTTGNQFIPELSDEHDSWCWAPLTNPPEPIHPGARQAIDKMLVAQDAANAGIVSSYVSSLKATVHDNDKFDSIVSRLRGDSGVRTDEMREIAKGFLGYELGKSKGRTEALKWIVDRQALEMRQVSRGATLRREGGGGGGGFDQQVAHPNAANIASRSELNSIGLPSKQPKETRAINVAFAHGGTTGPLAKQSKQANRYIDSGGLTEHDRERTGKSKAVLGKDTVKKEASKGRFFDAKSKDAEYVEKPHLGRLPPRTAERLSRDDKETKEEANYIDGPVDTEPCKHCTMFESPRGCSAVIGDISPTGHCDLFEAATAEDSLRSTINRMATADLERRLQQNLEMAKKAAAVGNRKESGAYMKIVKRLKEEIEQDTGRPYEINWGDSKDAEDFRTERGFVAKLTDERGSTIETSPLMISRNSAQKWLDEKSAKLKRLGRAVQGAIRESFMDPAYIHADAIAFDEGSVRTTDPDGRLHVATTNISKAVVNPYKGSEIPDYEKLGLEPDKIYHLYRDPDELAKAAPTFNNLPLLKQHVPITADTHKPELVIGSTGTDASFESPYLKNSLVVWTRDGIKNIESNKKKELSSAYRYTADMTPGMWENPETGERVNFDGTMRELIGNHVALVSEGRAGHDVVVGDAALSKVTWGQVEVAILEIAS